jgi:hypothetical protein
MNVALPPVPHCYSRLLYQLSYRGTSLVSAMRIVAQTVNKEGKKFWRNIPGDVI